MAGKPDMSKGMETKADKDSFYKKQLETAKRNLAAAKESGDQKKIMRCEDIINNLTGGLGRL